MKVLVTGGAGYIGSHAVLELKRAGHEPVIFDSFLRGHRDVAERLDVPVIEGDLCREGDIEAALRSDRFDAVMHFAAVALVSESMRDPGLYYTVNVAGGLRLLNALRAADVRRLIFSSTAAVYGIPEVTPIPETARLAPVNPYGDSKLAFEQMMRSFARAYGIRALALRYFNAAGTDVEAGLGELHTPETHLIPSLLRVAMGLGRTAMIFGTDYDTRDGTCVRDFIHVTDLARIHVLALEHLEGLSVDALNVGTGRGSTVREVVQLAQRVTGKSFPVIEAPRRAGDPPALVASPELAEAALGFRPSLDLESMVTSAWKYMSSQGDRLSASPRRFGEAAVSAGLITDDDVQAGLAEQQRRDAAGEEHALLGLILVDMGLLRQTQLIEVLKLMNQRGAALEQGESA